jgi:hypothetical protein
MSAAKVPPADNTLVIDLCLHTSDGPIRSQRLVSLEQLQHARTGLPGILANAAWEEILMSRKRAQR